MDLWTAVLDVVILLATALSLGVVLGWLRQHAVVGYLLAGLLLGPGVLNVVHSQHLLQALAELGVTLLLFAIGLEFSWRRLRSLGRLALLGGTLQVVVTAGAIAGACLLLGMPPAPTLAVGIIIAPSSTAVVLRLLSDRAEVDSTHGRAVLGILLLQDAALVPLLLLITTLSQDAPALQVIWGFARSIVLMVLLVAALYGTANYVLPHVFSATALARNRELPILLATTSCLAAAWAAHAMDLSPAVGASWPAC